MGHTTEPSSVRRNKTPPTVRSAPLPSATATMPCPLAKTMLDPRYVMLRTPVGVVDPARTVMNVRDEQSSGEVRDTSEKIWTALGAFPDTCRRSRSEDG